MDELGLLSYVPRTCGDGVLRQWQAILSRCVREGDERERARSRPVLDAVNTELGVRAAERARRAAQFEG